MKRRTLFLSIAISAVCLAFAAPTIAVAKTASSATKSDSIWIGGFGRLHSWRAVGRDELIIWASPSRPYLVKIWRPFSSLRFAHTIGVSSTVGRITKFDNVYVDGQRLPIKSIVALDRDLAKSIRWPRRRRRQ